MNRWVFAVLCATFAASAAFADGKPITGSFNKKPASGTRLLAVGSDGRASSSAITSKTFSIAPPGTAARLYLLKDGSVNGQLVLSKCRGASSSPKQCAASAVYTEFKAGKKLGTFLKSGSAYVIKSVSLSSVVVGSKADALNFVPIGLANAGLGNNPSISSLRTTQTLGDDADPDQDGLVSPVDVDDDGDSVIDNYDSTSPAAPQSSFRVFSNLKLDIEASLNYYTTGLAEDQVLRGLAQQTLAIQVAGTGSETTELDCTGLSYCSPGGTGTLLNSSTAFPGTAGTGLDPDGDGFGTITAGGAGSDFQLATHPESLAAVAAGDTLIQRITAADGLASRQVPGVLNFVFSSTPGIKSVAVNGGAAQEISYTASPVLGARNNCISVPASGKVELEVVGYRPQRPGVLANGEAQHVNLANSLITIDIPNGPVGGGIAAGPGNCTAGYSSSDSNLSASTSGIQDRIARDYDVLLGVDDDKRFAFAIDVTQCLAAANPPVAWASGQQLFLDLQFRSKDGDNAATKFCVQRQ